MTAKHYNAGSFTCSSSIGYLLKISHLLMHDWVMTAFAEHDLSFIQWLALMKLREGKVATASDLCKAMLYDNGSVTRLLDQLEERGLLRRERSKSDRRVIHLKLTPAGEKKLADLIPVAVEGLNCALSDFSKAEFAQLSRLLNKLIASLRERSATNASGAAA
jgi:DNA-binding MarR family transcriptional regulator